MEDLGKRAREVAEKAASKEGLLPFLRVCAENRQLSLVNQLLVYSQNPDAKMVCGKAAWGQVGRSVKAEAVPIRIIFPEISLAQDVKYRAVNVYDYDSTDGKEQTEKKRKIAYADRITQLTGATWEIVPEAAMKDSLDRGHYDSERNIFYLSEMCSGEQQEQTILGLYIDYVLGSVGIQDRLVKLAVSFVVYERFGIKHTIVGVLFGKVGKLTADEKWEFLKRICCVSKKVLDDMEGCTLSFNEIAFVNSLLTTDEPEEIEMIFLQATNLISVEGLREELLLLKEKLLKTSEGYLTKLYKKRCDKQLFTYPPVTLELEEEDYLREERRFFDGEYGYLTED